MEGIKIRHRKKEKGSPASKFHQSEERGNTASEFPCMVSFCTGNPMSMVSCMEPQVNAEVDFSEDEPEVEPQLLELTSVEKPIDKNAFMGIPHYCPLPPEIWTTILDNLEDPTDLINCSRLSAFFDDVLAARKTIYLFDPVFPILFGYISFQDLKSTRCVCRGWSAVVDRFLDALPSRTPYNDVFHLSHMNHSLSRRSLGGYTRLTSFTPWVTIMGSQEHFNAFDQTYKDLDFDTRNPFLGHAVQLLLIPDFFDVDQRPLPLLHFMKTYGHHIWHLRLFFGVQVDCAWRLLSYYYFRCCLRHLPNLRSLTLILPNAIEDLRELEDEVDTLTYLLDVAPLVELPHLQMFEIIHDPRTPFPLTRVAVHPLFLRVSRLTISHWDERIAVQLPLLKELNLYKIGSNAQLESTSYLNAPILQKLSLCFDYKWVEPSALNAVLTNFPLRVLLLEWVNPQKVNLPAPQPSVEAGEVPTLHTLYMMHDLDVNYAFLKWFPNLEFMYLTELKGSEDVLAGQPRQRHLSRVVKQEMVQIHECLHHRTFCDSNVWQIFDKLTFVSYDRIHEEEHGREVTVRRGQGDRRGAAARPSGMMSVSWERKVI